MSTSSPTIDQIISQAGMMNSLASPFDLNTIFEDFDDSKSNHYSNNNNKALQSTDDMMHSLLNQPSPSFRSIAPTPSNYTSPMMNTPCLDTFHTPFTPSATGFMTDSPMMTTPYMDPLMHSAFSTPMIDASATPFMGSAALNDADMEQYLTPAMAPATDFAPADHDDSLFPPLTHEDQQPHQSIDNAMDDLFDDLFGTPADVFPSNNDASSPPTPLKRQHDDDDLPRKQAKVDRHFICTICDRSFNRRYNLGTHIKTHNKDRVKPFLCDLCPKSFDRKHDCERHLSTVHRGERLFTCQPCSVSFSRRDALHRHQAQKH